MINNKIGGILKVTDLSKVLPDFSKNMMTPGKNRYGKIRI
jgi:hypothetical protein